jgi:hypothetical protein
MYLPDSSCTYQTQGRPAREDHFYRAPRNERERQWLLENRPEAARHWNLLSDLRPEHLQYTA